MSNSLESALEGALGSAVRALRPIAGGDINEAYAVTLASGEEVFVKTCRDAPPGMYVREAEGLSWLAEARALRTPDIRLAGERFLVLELVQPRKPCADFDERFGRGLARLHAFGAPSFGLSHDNFIANLPQPNAPLNNFCDFYRERRLEPLLRRAHAAELLDARHVSAFLRLFPRLEQLIPAEPAARLHGDLWTGNVHVDQTGAPMLIDPAVYGGHRELDLAMLQLFGSPSQRFFAAYDQTYPRAQGHQERVALWQLYPLLVHVCLFGRAYVRQLESALFRYL